MQGPNFLYSPALKWILPHEGAMEVIPLAYWGFKRPEHIPCVPGSICYTIGLSSYCDPAKGEPRLPMELQNYFLTASVTSKEYLLALASQDLA